MKRTGILGFVLGLILVSNLAFRQELLGKSPDEPYGFRDIDWGDHIGAFPDMKLVRIESYPYGDIQVYKRENDKLQMGESALERIEYRFWKDRACNVYICTEGSTNWSALRDTIRLKFGTGYKFEDIEKSYWYWVGEINRRVGKEHQIDEYQEKYYWFGKRTSMLLGYDIFHKKGLFFMISTEKLKEQTEKSKERVGKDF